MYSRYLGGLMACLGLAGVLSAQQPAPRFAQSDSLSIPSPLYRTATQAPPSTPAANPPKSASGAAQPATPAGPTTPTQPSATSPVPPSALGYPSAGGLGGACGPDGTCAPACPTICDCLCGPPGRFWVSAEYLLWRAKGQNIPPLITSAPPGTSRDTAGVLGAPTTSVLYGGGSDYNNNFRSGFRLNAGAWLDECQRCGIEGNFFFLGRSRDNYTAGSDGSQIITRPFFNVLQNRQDAELVSFSPDTQLVSSPGVLAGSVSVQNTSQLIGGGVNFLQNICCDPCGRLDLLLGYRHINLRDEVTINENLTALPGSNVPAGTRFLIQDRFRTSNDFDGGVIGFNYERRFSHYFIGIRPTVALGNTHTVVTIDGSTQIIAPNGTSQTFPGGLLTQPTNIGRYSSNTFSVVPEITVRAGVQLTDHLRAFVSYNYLYWSQVARAGDQIDLRVNTNQIAPPTALNGPANPAFELRRTGYYVQGIGFGAEYRW